ncbi:hypothetical protein JM80_3179 [Cellulophaga sp. RHA_52]|uniref:hypothetical protein n=1 Tax=Cellulophaga sp. RHA_52 TaxID=1250036 RepID=UPI00119B0E47|nr:hypothetical protein [Cellulophaga sp. RHA_52]TVZ10626.1 hypothetical protein JM80_3179 [Cellulophaga sp. RHA_52]
MKNTSHSLLVILFFLIIVSCDKKITFEQQISQDVYQKIASGYCEEDKIPKDAVIKNFKIGEITPIGDTGMIDVALEFDVTDADGNEEHITEAMLYLDKGKDKKMLAIFCEYDYRKQ